MSLGKSMKKIARATYLDRLINVKNTQDIKVITGVRRSGKSEILNAFVKYIRERESKANIVYINMQELEFEELLDYHKLNDYILSHYNSKENNYLMIDEVQLCKNFEKTINSIHTKNIFDIYVTGSNAFLLSSDLATLFTGRVFEIEIFPFSFKEFMEIYKYDDPQKVFDEYRQVGGFAGSYDYKDIRDKYDYIQREVYQTIVVRDLIKKYKVQARNKETLENLASYLMDNISNLTSAANITDTFNASGNDITNKTVSRYLDYLCNAFVFYKANRYDLKGKKRLSTENKYYLVDHSLRSACLGTINYDYGRILENMVYIELLRRGYEVYIGKLYKKEIDFVAKKRNEELYIQVSSYIEDPRTFEREVFPLLAVKNAYPKILIARTMQDDYQYNGIQIIDIANWLSK